MRCLTDCSKASNETVTKYLSAFVKEMTRAFKTDTELGNYKNNNKSLFKGNRRPWCALVLQWAKSAVCSIMKTKVASTRRGCF